MNQKMLDIKNSMAPVKGAIILTLIPPATAAGETLDKP